MPTLFDRFRVGWNAFRDGDPTNAYPYIGPASATSPSKPRMRMSTERSVVLALYNRIAVDASSIMIKHVRLDADGRFIEVINSGLNNCLTLEANLDQSGRAFIQDVVMSMFDEGSVAIVPVDTTTTTDSIMTGSYEILTLRTAKILQWHPYHVRLSLYHEQNGQKEEIVLKKNQVAIVENPLFGIMNEPNSVLKRLIDKLNILDAIDTQSGSGKLDLIIQLPYVIKTDARKAQAEKRRKDIEEQLKGSQYGIAYTDGTEKVTQLNRPAENNLMKQIEFLTSMLYGQLGITESILDGTADEKTMLNYQNRTIEPIVTSIIDAMKRRFLTKTAITQGQSIKFFKDRFGLMTGSDLATAADNLTRNAIVSSNEMRDVYGLGPSDDPEADKLKNKNLNPSAPKSSQNTNNNASNSEQLVNNPVTQGAINGNG